MILLGLPAIPPFCEESIDKLLVFVVIIPFDLVSYLPIDFEDYLKLTYFLAGVLVRFVFDGDVVILFASVVFLLIEFDAWFLFDDFKSYLTWGLSFLGSAPLSGAGLTLVSTLESAHPISTSLNLLLNKC